MDEQWEFWDYDATTSSWEDFAADNEVAFASLDDDGDREDGADAELSFLPTPIARPSSKLLAQEEEDSSHLFAASMFKSSQQSDAYPEFDVDDRSVDSECTVQVSNRKRSERRNDCDKAASSGIRALFENESKGGDESSGPICNPTKTKAAVGTEDGLAVAGGGAGADERGHPVDDPTKTEAAGAAGGYEEGAGGEGEEKPLATKHGCAQPTISLSDSLFEYATPPTGHNHRRSASLPPPNELSSMRGAVATAVGGGRARAA